MLFPLLCGDFVFDLEPWIPRESIDVYQQSISTENQPPMNNIQKTIKKEQPCQINNLPQTCEDLNESKKPRINLNLGRWKWTQAYDDIVYGIRAKLFVLKINFKSNFGHLKGLVSRKFNRIFHKREPFTFNNYYPRYPRSEIDSSLSRDTRLNIDYDKGFWARLGDCKSIKNQRCKIMYRLEKYMREKKQLSNRQLRHNLTADWLSNQVIDLGPDCKIERQSQNNLGKTFENNSQLRNCCYKSQSHTRKGPQKRNNKQPIHTSMDCVRTEIHGKSKQCIICYTNLANILTLPCKHADICSECFIEIIYYAFKYNRFPLRCVLCRQKIEKVRCSTKLILSVISEKKVS